MGCCYSAGGVSYGHGIQTWTPSETLRGCKITWFTRANGVDVFRVMNFVDVFNCKSCVRVGVNHFDSTDGVINKTIGDVLRFLCGLRLVL